MLKCPPACARSGTRSSMEPGPAPRVVTTQQHHRRLTSARPSPSPEASASTRGTDPQRCTAASPRLAGTALRASIPYEEQLLASERLPRTDQTAGACPGQHSRLRARRHPCERRACAACRRAVGARKPPTDLHRHGLPRRLTQLSRAHHRWRGRSRRRPVRPRPIYEN